MISLAPWFPLAGFKILLVLVLSFLVGFERENLAGAGSQSFGGVRTYPLIGLIGYAMALIAPDGPWGIAVGFLAISGFLLVSYRHKLETSTASGLTSEMSALAIYLVGALVSREEYWIATTLSVVSLLLLELKVLLEGLARRMAHEDILSLAKFLLLTAVILPIVPDRALTPYAINPFKTWLTVVAVSGISYASYVLQKLLKNRGGTLLTAVLGGLYSSTLTTIVLARRAGKDDSESLVSGAILMASGMMYLRLSALMALFNERLSARLAPRFILLAVLALASGWFWSRRGARSVEQAPVPSAPTNPLELRAALAFGVLFVAMLVASELASEYLGRAGIYGLAAVMGVTDVDPFILSLAQAAPASPATAYAAAAIVIAAASNNVVKGVYAAVLAPRGVGRQSLYLLLGLAAAGLLPLW